MKKYVLSESAANKVRELISATPGVSRRTVATSGAGIVDDYAPPFTVQYAASIDSGSGGWIVWLPAGCVNINGTEVTPADSGGTALEAAGAPYPAGWYKLAVTDPSALYLAIYARTSSGSATTPLARISGAAPASSAYPSGYGAPVVVRICAISGKIVKQTLASAVVINIGADTPAPAAPFAYSETTSGGSVVRSITNNNFYFNGELKTIADFTGVPVNGTVYLVCTGTPTELGSLDWTFALATAPGSATTDGKVINIKLYDFSGGEISMDYRATFLTLAEPTGLAEKTFTFDGSDVAKILADDDIDVGQKTLAAGSGVSLSVSADGKTITISATGGSASTSGYTGTRTILRDADYDPYSYSLRRKYITETWSNGVLTASTEGAWEVYHTAVEETV